MDMRKQNDRRILSGLCGAIIAGLLLSGLFPPSAQAQVDCDALPHWVALENGLQMNQKHVFCGEWDRNRPKGFHARPEGVNPTTVTEFTVQDKKIRFGMVAVKNVGEGAIEAILEAQKATGMDIRFLVPEEDVRRMGLTGEPPSWVLLHRMPADESPGLPLGLRQTGRSRGWASPRILRRRRGSAEAAASGSPSGSKVITCFSSPAALNRAT